MWDTYVGESGSAAFKQAIMWTIAFAGFASLGVRLGGRDWRYLYVAAALLLPMLPYILGAPIVRYRFPIGGLLVFLAADLVWRTAPGRSNSPSVHQSPR
jgi:hypothetical protein